MLVVVSLSSHNAARSIHMFSCTGTITVETSCVDVFSGDSKGLTEDLFEVVTRPAFTTGPPHKGQGAFYRLWNSETVTLLLKSILQYTHQSHCQDETPIILRKRDSKKNSSPNQTHDLHPPTGFGHPHLPSAHDLPSEKPVWSRSIPGEACMYLGTVATRGAPRPRRNPFVRTVGVVRFWALFGVGVRDMEGQVESQRVSTSTTCLGKPKQPDGWEQVLACSRVRSFGEWLGLGSSIVFLVTGETQEGYAERP